MPFTRIECARAAQELKGVEPAQQPQQLKVPVKEQQTTGQQTVEPQQTEPQSRQPVAPAAEKDLLEEKVAEPQPQQQQQQAQAQVQPTYAQRVAHEQPGQPGQPGQLGAQLQGQQPQLHKEQKEQQQGEAQLQPQQPQLQYVRQERVVAPAHRVIKVRFDLQRQRTRREFEGQPEAPRIMIVERGLLALGTALLTDYSA